MASNPMQRQKKVSFLLGFLTMLVLSVIVIGFLGYTLFQMKAEQKAEKEALRDVYVLSSDVESGGTIDSTVIKMQKVSAELVPNNKFISANLEDEEGNIRKDLVSKIDLKKGTVLTTDMVTVSSEMATNDLRKQEYNMISLPAEITTGDFIDIRIRFASGLDFIILSKKQINIPQVAGVDAADTFTINLAEHETLLMSSAIVEAYSVPGTEIYVNTFTDPGMQTAATPTYNPSPAVINLIEHNPNVVIEARNALFTRYRETSRERDAIQSELDKVDEDERIENIDAGIQDHILRQKQFKQQYLEELSGV